MSSKENKHKLSEAVLSLEASLRPLRYVNPVVLCTLTDPHCDFMDSPVPLIIGFWGTQNRLAKLVNKLKKAWKKTEFESGVPTVMLDV